MTHMRHVRLLLEIGESRDWFLVLWLTLLLSVFSLITAAITGSTAIAVVERAYSGGGSVFQSASRYIENCYNYSSTPLDTSVLTWEVTSPSNISYITQWNSEYSLGCPSQIYGTFSSIQAIFGQGYASHDQRGNVCHHTLGGDLLCSALGAPLLATSYCNFFRPFSCVQGISNSACVPVFSASPVSCRAGGSITTENGKVSAVSGANCSAASVVKKLNDHDIVSYCPTKDAVGDMTFVLGTNDGTSSDYLKALLPTDGSSSSDETSIECTISLNSTMQWVGIRNTTWTRQSTEATYPAIEGTSETCDPELTSDISQVVNDQARLAAAIFLYHIFDESSFSNVFMGSVAFHGDTNDGIILDPPPKVFNASANSLEDYLGVQVGSAMSYYFGQMNPSYGNNLGYVGQYTVYADRVGPGTPIAVLYVLPALCALLVLIWLDWFQPGKHAH